MQIISHRSQSLSTRVIPGILIGILLISGCSGTPPRKTPAPIINSRINMTSPPQAMTRQQQSMNQQRQEKFILFNDNLSIRPPLDVEPKPPSKRYPIEVRAARNLTGEARTFNLIPPSNQDFYGRGDEDLGIGIGTRTASDDPNTTLVRYQYTAPSAPSPSYGRAVTTLLAIAEREQSAGRFDSAASQLEHAIDLESRNASLWRRLAELRMAQGKYDSAEQAARTSNGLAAGNLPLQRSNWQLIAEARFELGDNVGASKAARMAEDLF